MGYKVSDVIVAREGRNNRAPFPQSLPASTPGFPYIPPSSRSHIASVKFGLRDAILTCTTNGLLVDCRVLGTPLVII